MNNHCTPATSERLKAAGFPQPASPAPGQWWCMGKETTYIAAASGQYFTVIRFTPGGRPEVDEYFDLLDFEGRAFMPGVADLLRELGEYYAVVYCCPVYEVLSVVNGGYCIFAKQSHEKPAEALSAAWLELNEK